MKPDTKRKMIERAQLRDDGGKVLHTNLSAAATEALSILVDQYGTTQRLAVEAALCKAASACKALTPRRVAAILKQPRKP